MISLLQKINGKQAIIGTGDLSISYINGLQGVINNKQTSITKTTDLTLNSIITNDLNVDNVLTFEKEILFDTIVIKRVSNFMTMTLRELQVWIGGNNILSNNINTSTNQTGNSLGETPEFFNNDTNKTETALSIEKIASNISNNKILSDVEVASLDTQNSNNSSLYIPLLLTFDANNIQAIVLYNGTSLLEGALGLRIELYNRKTNRFLSTPVVVSNTIHSASSVYRFDFPKISTYPSALFLQEDSINYIVIDTYAFTEGVSTDGNSSEEIKGVSITRDLSISKTLNTNDLVVSNSLSVDSRKYFDTIVIRRPSGITGEASGVDFYIALRELQVWIDGSNLLPNSPNVLISYYANWAVDKADNLGSLGGSVYNVKKLYNEMINTEYSTHSLESTSTADIALIVKNIPLTRINSIQALVLYNRTGEFNNTTIGLAIELYNSTQDPAFTEILATTNVITSAFSVYRFDFPAISSYSSFATGESVTNIIQQQNAITQVVNVSERRSVMRGGLFIDGDLITNKNLIMNTGLISSTNNFKITTIAENANTISFPNGSGSLLQLLQTGISNGNGYLLLIITIRALSTFFSPTSTLNISYTDVNDNILFQKSYNILDNDPNIQETYSFYLNMGQIVSGTNRKIKFTRTSLGFVMDNNSRTNAILIELPFQ